MEQPAFGDVLRYARESKGEDIAQVSRKLRIRPDILRAIEECDFANMPARGYTRSMVASYARYVGLNAKKITNLYLEDLYAHEINSKIETYDDFTHVSGRRSINKKNASASGSSRGSTNNSTRNRSNRSRNGRSGAESTNESSARTARNSRTRTRQESTRHTNRPRKRNQQNSGSNRRGQNSKREHGASTGGIGSAARGAVASAFNNFDTLATRAARANNQEGRRVGSTAQSRQFGNFYTGNPSANPAKKSYAKVLVVIAIILILLVIIVSLAFGNRGATQTQEASKVPITGVTDTSQSQDAQAQSQQQATETAPTSVVVEYKLESGKQAYVVITQDGNSTQSMLTGPVNQKIEVSGTWSLATYVTSDITVTMAGNAVEFVNDSSTGMPTATVNFQDYLVSWAKEHPNATINLDSLTTSNSSTNTDSSNSASTSTDTSTSSSTSGTATNSSSGTSTGTTGTGTSTSSTTGTTGTTTGTYSSTG